jgi:hypothetical protein
MRKALFWLGCSVLIALPVIFGVQIFLMQDIPSVELWQWSIPSVALVLIYLSRNKDEVLKHHLV